MRTCSIDHLKRPYSTVVGFYLCSWYAIPLLLTLPPLRTVVASPYYMLRTPWWMCNTLIVDRERSQEHYLSIVLDQQVYVESPEEIDERYEVAA